MSNFVTEKRSPFGNTYGSLTMIRNIETDEVFLQMDDCFGPDFFGPLTEEQQRAFELLCDVTQTQLL